MTPEQKKLLEKYAEAVTRAPSHLHLTSEKDQAKFWERHVLDAVHLVESIPTPYIRKGRTKAVDIGSGNGVPGVILSILRSDFDVILVDSDNKKCGFLDMFCNLYAIKNMRVICDRAETIVGKGYRDSFDIATTRALGKTPVALELAAGFLKRGGLLIVPHGTSWKEAYKESEGPAKFLGFTPLSSKPYPMDSQEFGLLMYKKTSDTPQGYPRSNGIPAKRPLK